MTSTTNMTETCDLSREPSLPEDSLDPALLAKWNNFEKKLLQKSSQRKTPTSPHTTPRLWFDSHRVSDGDYHQSIKSDKERFIAQCCLKSCKKTSFDSKASFVARSIDRSRSKDLSKARDLKTQKFQMFARLRRRLVAPEPDSVSESSPPESSDDVPENISGSRSFIQNLSGAFTTAADLPSLIGSFQDEMKTSIHGLKSEVIDDLRQLMTEFSTKMVGHSISIIAMASFAYCVIEVAKKPTGPLIALTSCLLIFLLWHFGVFQQAFHLIGDFSNWCSHQAHQKLQGPGTVDTLARIFVTIMSYWTVSAAPTAKQMHEALQCFSNFDRASKGMTEFASWITESLRSLYFKYKLWTGVTEIELMKTDIATVDDWVKTVLPRLSSFDPAKDFKPEVARDLKSMLNRGVALLCEKRSDSESRRVNAVISELLKRLEKALAVVDASGVESMPRQTPIYLFMSGPPGTGKSYCTLEIASRLLYHIYRREPEMIKAVRDNFMLYIHVRESINDFWDGVRMDVPIFIYNDALQMKPEAEDREPFEWLKLGDNTPYHAHMSSVQDKSKMYLAPRAILISSNSHKVSNNYMTQPNALTRRMTLKVRSCIAEAYAKNPGDPAHLRTLDFTKLEKHRLANGGIPFIPGVQEYYACDEEGNINREICYSFDDLVQYLKDAYDRQEANYKAYMETNMARHKALGDKYLDAAAPTPEPAPVPAEPKLKAHAAVQDLQMKPGNPKARKIPPAVEGACSKMNLSTEYYRLWLTKGFDAEAFMNNYMRDAKLFRAHLISIETDTRRIREAEAAEAKAPEPVRRLRDYYYKGSIAPDLPPFVDDSVFKVVHAGEPIAPITTLDQLMSIPAPIMTAPRTNVNLAGAIRVAHPHWHIDTVCAVAAHLAGMHAEAIRREMEGEFLARVAMSNWSAIAAKSVFTVPDFFRHKIDNVLNSVRTRVAALWATITQSQWFHDFMQALSTLTIVATAYIVVVAVIVLVAKFIAWVTGADEPQKAHSAPKEPKIERRLRRAQEVQSMERQPAPVRSLRRVQKTQGPHDKVCDDITARILKKNEWVMYDEKGNSMMQFTILQGRLCIVNHHFVSWLQKEEDRSPIIVNNILNPEIERQIACEDIFNGQPVEGSADLWSFVITNLDFPEGYDIVPYFLNEKDHELYCKGNFPMAIFVPRLIDKVPVIIERVVTAHCDEQVEAYSERHGMIKIKNAYAYHGDFREGDCGSLGVVRNSQTKGRKIASIHMSGDEELQLGTGMPVTREMIDKVLTQWPPQISRPPVMMTAVPKNTTDSGATIVAEVPRQMAASVGVENELEPTKVQKTQMARLYPSQRRPARLKRFRDEAGVLHDPLHDAVNRYVDIPVPLQNFEGVREVCQAEFANIVNSNSFRPPRELRVLTFEEALCGDGTGRIRSTVRKTSPGWPLVKQTDGKPGKTKWLGTDGPIDPTTPQALELKAMVMEILDNAEKGIRMPHVTMAVPKDELRSYEKWLSGKTRLIMPTSLPYFLACKMMYGDFLADIIEGRIRNGYALGINRYSREWDTAGRFLKRSGLDGEGMYAGDFEGLDSTTRMYILICIHEYIIMPHYRNSTPRQDMARRVLWSDMYQYLVIYDVLIHELVNSYCSGHLATAFTATAYGRVAFRLAFRNLHPQGPVAGTLSFDASVSLLAQGDDHVVHPAEPVREWFKPTTWAPQMAKIGLRYTTADKKKIETDEWEDLSKVTFLKCKWRHEPRYDRYVAPISLETVRELPYWHPKWDKNNIVAMDNFSIALHELSLHDMSIWNEMSPVMFKSYYEAYNEEFPIREKNVLMDNLTSTTWENASRILSVRGNTREWLQDQTLIGLMGGGASKGDGPLWHLICPDNREIFMHAREGVAHDGMCEVIARFEISRGGPRETWISWNFETQRWNPAHFCAEYQFIVSDDSFADHFKAAMGEINDATHLYWDRYWTVLRRQGNNSFINLEPREVPIFGVDKSQCSFVLVKSATKSPVHSCAPDPLVDVPPFDGDNSWSHSPDGGWVFEYTDPDEELTYLVKIEYFYGYTRGLVDVPFDPYINDSMSVRGFHFTPPFDEVLTPGSNEPVNPRLSLTRRMHRQVGRMVPAKWWVDSVFLALVVFPIVLGPFFWLYERLMRVRRTGFGPLRGAFPSLALGMIPLCLVILLLAISGTSANIQLSRDPSSNWEYSSAHDFGSPEELRQVNRNLTLISHQDFVSVVLMAQPTVEPIKSIDTPVQGELVSTKPAEMQGIGAMSTDKPGEVVKMQDPMSTPSSIVSTNSTHTPNDVRQRLGTWVLVGSGNIDGSHAAGSTILSFDPGVEYLTDSSGMIAPAVTGFQGIKATLRVKLMVNASDSCQGRLLMVWIPQGDAGLLPGTRATDLVLATQLPRVELDIATESECEMEIPWVAPCAFHDMTTGTPSWGSVYFLIYSPFATGSGTGASTNFGYSIFVSAVPESVELFNPTKMTVPSTPYRRIQRLQSGAGKRSVKKKSSNITDTEAQASGKVSTFLGKVAKTAEFVEVAVPDLSAFAGIARWAADIGAGVAAAFGYEKPNDESASSYQTTSINHGAANCDGIQTVQSTAITKSSKVDVLPGFAGSNVDEMSMEYLLSKSYFLSSVSWAQAATSGSTLFTLIPTPANLRVLRSGPPAYYVAGPLGYLSKFFRLWRGPIVVRLKFVKTPYHTGRLCVAWYPGLSSDPGFTSSAFCHREFIDVGGEREFAFLLPFTTNLPYKSVNASCGLFAVYVVTELNNPSTVSTSIQMLVEISGGPGFELSGYTDSTWGPYVPAVGMLELKAEEERKKASVQRLHAATGTRKTELSRVAAEIGGAQAAPSGLDASRYVAGHKIMSIKQLLLASSPIECSVATSAAQVAFRPFTVGVAFNNAGVVTNGDLSMDPYAWFCPMYAYQRGGVIYRRTNLQSTSVGAFARHRVTNNDYINQANPVAVYSDTNTGYRWVDHPATGGGGVYVPSYDKTWARLCRVSASRAGVGTPEPLDNFSSWTLLIQNLPGTAAMVSETQRAVADDFQLGFFLGCPPFASLNGYTEKEQKPLPLSVDSLSQIDSGLPPRSDTAGDLPAVRPGDVSAIQRPRTSVPVVRLGSEN